MNFRLKQFFYGNQFEYSKAHYSWRLIFSPEDRVKILGTRYKELVYDTDPIKIFETHFKHVKDLHPLDQSLYVDTMTWLQDDILVKVDRSSMHYGLEVRSPYLDTALAEYAASLPASWKMKGFKTKYILKKSLSNTLPDWVLTKKKSGFNAPIRSWFPATHRNEFQQFNSIVLQKHLNTIKHSGEFNFLP